MKKTIKFAKLLLIVIVLLGIAGATVFATTGKSKASFVRIRKSATTQSEVLAVLDEGDTVEIIGEEGDWYKVKAKGFTGYVSKQFINQNNSVEQNANNNTQNSTENNASSNANENNTSSNMNENNTSSNASTEVKPNTTTIVKKVYKVAGDANVYILPILSSETIGMVKNGEEINIINNTGLWGFIKTPSITGWVRIDKLSSTEVTETVEQTNNNSQPQNENKSEDNNTSTNTNVENTQNNNAENTNTENKDNSSTQNNQTNTEENNKPVENNNAEKNKTNTESNETNNAQQSNYIEKTMYVSATAINVRSEANTTSEVVSGASLNTAFTVVGEENGWYKVKVNGNNFGYVRKDLLSDKKTEETSRSDTVNRTEANKQQTTQTKQVSGVSGTDIANYAKQFVGCKYVYGAAGPSSFDCSGLTMYVYKHFGYSLSHSSKVQATQGVKVTGDLQPGDILVFSNDGKQVGHVGIYIGNDKFVHASDSTTGVIISNLHDKWNISKYWGARRIIQ